MSLWFIYVEKSHIICAVRLDFEVWTKLSHLGICQFVFFFHQFQKIEIILGSIEKKSNHSFLSRFDCDQNIFRSGAKVFLAAPLRLESRDQDDNIIQYQPSSHLLPYTVQKQSKLDCHIVHYFSMISPTVFEDHCASFQGYFRVVGSHWGHGLAVICAYFCIDCIWLHMIALYICDLPGCGCGCSWLQLTRYGWLWWLWRVRDRAFVKRSDTKVVFW